MRHGAAGRGTDEGPLVDVKIELETHLQQQAALDDARWNFRCADRAQQDAIEPTELIEHRIAEDLAVAQVARPAQIEVGGVDVDACRPNHLQRFGRDLRADPVATDDCNAMCHTFATVPFDAVVARLDVSPAIDRDGAGSS